MPDKLLKLKWFGKEGQRGAFVKFGPHSTAWVNEHLAILSDYPHKYKVQWPYRSHADKHNSRGHTLRRRPRYWTCDDLLEVYAILYCIQKGEIK